MKVTLAVMLAVFVPLIPSMIAAWSERNQKPEEEFEYDYR